MKKHLSLIVVLFCLASISAYGLFDDFSSGSLNPMKWTISQDVEGQPLFDEYGVIEEGGNYVFHTQQNEIGDRRVYLIPNYTFTTGDIIEYDFNVISKEGHYGQMVLLTGDQYIRIGIMGYNNGVQGYDELGLSHVKIKFQENNLQLTRITPSGLVLVDNLPLSNANGNYALYIGSFSGHNGRTHIDYDNFYINHCKFVTTKINGYLCVERVFGEPTTITPTLSI